MLQVIAQDHEVMHLAARRFFRFPIQHLIEIVLTGVAASIEPRRIQDTFDFRSRLLHQITHDSAAVRRDGGLVKTRLLED